MNIKNIFFGISLFVLSGIIFVFGSNFPNFVVRGQKLPGPKFFPYALAFVLIGLGVYFVIKSIVLLKLKKTPRDASLAPAEKITFEGVKNVVAIIAGILFFVPLINLLGFLLGAMVISTVLMTTLNVKLWHSLIYSAVLVVLIFLIFGMVFKIPLPEGSLIAMFQG